MSERIVIVGSGIAGMCTALALAKRGLDITVLERDTPPPVLPLSQTVPILIDAPKDWL